jgi:hypothetical protein
VTITVVLTEAAAASLAECGDTSVIENLTAIIEGHAGSISPVHPGTDDLDLRRFFAAEIPVEADPTRLIEELLTCDAVDGAYVKPEEELP